MQHPKIEYLRNLRARYYLGGGPDRIAKQHAVGKLTARERLSMLFDPDTFQESYLFVKNRCTDFGMNEKQLPGEGVVTGVGLTDGRPVFAASQDFTVAGGSVGRPTPRRSPR